MDDHSRRAVAAALAVSRGLGLQCSDEPEIVADGSNVLVHLVPSQVVARVATTTALVRKPPERWLALDIDLAGYLAAHDFPVVPPSRELAAGPHRHDGFALTFWEFVEHDRSHIATAQEVGPFLLELHNAIRNYYGDLRLLSPFAEIPQWLDEVETWNTVDPADLTVLRRGFALVSAEIEALHLPGQPLHGDSHKKNVLKARQGLVWTDFEDACFGPIEWDLACFVRTSLEPRDVALASYGGQSDPAHLKPFFAARDLQGAVWGAILSTRFPDRRERAAEWMAVVRSRYSQE